MTRLQVWLILVILSWYAVLAPFAIANALGAQVTVRQMIGDPRYWPGDNGTCRTSPCVLTGLGGLVPVWERYVDDNRARGFVVKGVCASACEIAYRRAVQLIPHKPSPAKWQ